MHAFAGYVARACAVAVLAAGLAACSSLGLDSLNPFAENKPKLPGHREAVLVDADPLVVPSQGSGGAVSLPAATANQDWPQPGGPASNAPGNLALSSSPGRAWRASAVGGSRGRGGTRLSISPIVYQGRIYVVDTAGDLHAFSVGDGRRQWTGSVRPEYEDGRGVVGGGVAADGGHVYLASGFGIVAAFNAATGAKAWEVNLKVPVRSAPTAANGKLYMVTTENRIVVLNTADGSQAWDYMGIAETTGLLADVSPAVADNVLVVPYASGEIVAFDAASGEPRWIDSLARSARFSSVTGINAVAGRPVIDRGTVYAVSIAGRLIASDLKTGERRWSRNIASTDTPMVAGDSVFVNGMENRLVAFSRTSGDVQWVAELPKGTAKERILWSGPVLGGGRLWLVSSNRKLLSVDAATGQVLGESDLGDPAYIAPVIANGRMIVLTDRGALVAYN